MHCHVWPRARGRDKKGHWRVALQKRRRPVRAADRAAQPRAAPARGGSRGARAGRAVAAGPCRGAPGAERRDGVCNRHTSAACDLKRWRQTLHVFPSVRNRRLRKSACCSAQGTSFVSRTRKPQSKRTRAAARRAHGANASGEVLVRPGQVGCAFHHLAPSLPSSNKCALTGGSPGHRTPAAGKV
jgi:hypothetical protein